jgi:hypothetical protein
MDTRPDLRPEILSIIFSHRTLALPKMNTVLLASRVSCPPLSALVYVSQAKEDIFIVDDDYDSGDAEGSDSEGRPLYFRQHHELVNYMKSWVRRDPAFTDEAVDLFHPDRDIGESGISKKLLQLEHGPILKNMLTTTGVRWASTNKSQLATQARTFANHSAAALWGHAHHGLAFLQHNEVWTLREQLDGYLQKALHQWRGFWDGVEEQPGGPYPEPAQTTISRPRKLELETTAMEMERKADESICKIYQMLLLPELGAIPANPQSKDADFLLAPQVYKRARSLVKVNHSSCFNSHSSSTNPTGDCAGIRKGPGSVCDQR